jgi:hypothetical protein
MFRSSDRDSYDGDVADHRVDGTAHGSAPEDRLLWDITSPRQPIRLPGVAMAGFGDRGITPPECS